MTPAIAGVVPPIIDALKPVQNGAAAGCLPEIGFVTVRTIVCQGVQHLQFLQSFALEQGQQNFIRTNGAVVTIHRYVGPYPMTLDLGTFTHDIIHAGRFEIPCTIVAPDYAATGESLDDTSLCDSIRNQWMQKNRTQLWLSLLNFCSPGYNTDPTTAVRELRQCYSDENNNPQSMHTRHYTSLFMMTLGAIIENDTPLLNYAFQYIPGLNENLKMQVEAVFDAHIGP